MTVPGNGTGIGAPERSHRAFFFEGSRIATAVLGKTLMALAGRFFEVYFMLDMNLASLLPGAGTDPASKRLIIFLDFTTDLDHPCEQVFLKAMIAPRSLASASSVRLKNTWMREPRSPCRCLGGQSPTSSTNFFTTFHNFILLPSLTMMKNTPRAKPISK